MINYFNKYRYLKKKLKSYFGNIVTENGSHDVECLDCVTWTVMMKKEAQTKFPRRDNQMVPVVEVIEELSVCSLIKIGRITLLKN